MAGVHTANEMLQQSPISTSVFQRHYFPAHWALSSSVNIAWVITVINTLVLALSLNQIEGGLLTQIFGVTLPTVDEHELRGGVILFVLRERLASDSFSEMNSCWSRQPHAGWLQNKPSTPLIDVLGVAVAHTEAICAWFMACLNEAVSSLAASNESVETK